MRFKRNIFLSICFYHSRVIDPSIFENPIIKANILTTIEEDSERMPLPGDGIIFLGHTINGFNL